MQRVISWARLKFNSQGVLPPFVLNEKSIADYDPMRKRRKPFLVLAAEGQAITVGVGDVIPSGSLKANLLKSFYESGIIRVADPAAKAGTSTTSAIAAEGPTDPEPAADDDEPDVVNEIEKALASGRKGKKK